MIERDRVLTLGGAAEFRSNISPSPYSTLITAEKHSENRSPFSLDSRKTRSKRRAKGYHCMPALGQGSHRSLNARHQGVKVLNESAGIQGALTEESRRNPTEGDSIHEG